MPDGRHFLFWVLGNPERQGIYLGTLDGGTPKRLAAADSSAEYLPPDRVVFMQQGALLARRIDLSRGELVGEPEVLAQSVSSNGLGGGAFSVSSGGIVAYRTGGNPATQIAWLDRSGKPAGGPLDPDADLPVSPVLSPDGRRLAVDRTVQGNRDVWLIDPAR